MMAESLFVVLNRPGQYLFGKLSKQRQPQFGRNGLILMKKSAY